jgi:hypothetical protein
MKERIPGLGDYRPHIYKENGIWKLVFRLWTYVNYMDNSPAGVWEYFKKEQRQ